MRGSAGAKALRTSRSSVAAGYTANGHDPVGGLWDRYAPLGYMLPWETLEYVELLATYNPDVSQAVENTRTLANSGHELFVSARGQRRTNNLKTDLELKARTIQSPHGGIDGLIDKLLKQAATFGAMCGEWVVSDTLDDVVDFIDVNPKTIRFFWEDEHWAPYQKVSGVKAKEAEARGQVVRPGNCIKLNELTFHYFAFDAAPGSPYGTPPFVAALANISIQQDMIHNMSQIVRKVGLLAIIDMVIEQLPRHPGETVSQYEARAGSYLANYATVTEDMMQDGGIVHFNDVEVKTVQVSGNAAGATAIFKQNEELIFSGLRSMPSVQGRSYSTTETYAGVAYDIIIRNTMRYQRAVKRMIEAGYWLMATMWGETPESIKIVFNSNKTLHRLQEAQAEKLEILNASLLWLGGALDHTSWCQRLGFDAPVNPMAQPPEALYGGQAANNLPEEGASAANDSSSGSGK